MRKGADCLSKWVGEAERQLRLLFEAAKAWQPSIIFFDEIDGTFSFPFPKPSKMTLWDIPRLILLSLPLSLLPFPLFPHRSSSSKV